MRVVVTGASGFVGGDAVGWLRARGHEVIPCGRRPASQLRRPIAGYVRWDLTRDRPDLPDVDAVVHCAAHVGDSADDPAFQATNVDGLHNLLAWLPAAARFVHVSSASVYDLESPLVQVTEDAPYGSRHLNAYSRTKIAAERILLASGRPVTILRPHTIYGPGDTHLLPGLLRASRFGVLPMYGDGTNLFSVTHVENLSRAVECAIDPAAPSGIYNVTDDGHAPLDEILRTLLARLGVNPRIAYIPRAIAWPAARFVDALPTALRGRGDRMLSRFLVSHMSKEFTMSTERARTRLGYAPRWTFRDGPLSERSPD